MNSRDRSLSAFLEGWLGGKRLIYAQVHEDSGWAEPSFTAEEGPGEWARREIGTLEEVCNKPETARKSESNVTHLTSELSALLRGGVLFSLV